MSTLGAGQQPSARPEPLSAVTLWAESRALIGSVLRLLRMQWLALLVIAIAGVAAHAYLGQLAIVLGRFGAVPGLLALALVPFSTLLTLIGMLLVLRRRVASRTVGRDLIAALGGVLLPFLVVYQSGRGGGLTEDMRSYMLAGFWDDVNRLGIENLTGTPRIPEATSVVVLGIVAVALTVRVIAERLVERDSLWRDQEDPRRMTLQVVAGYCELVWIVLGAFVVTYLVSGLAGWWRTRAVVHGVDTWWQGVSERLPTLADSVGALVSGIDAVIGAAGTVLVVPLAWLLVGVLIYGIRARDVVTLDGLPGRDRLLMSRVAATVQDPRVLRSWQRITEPKGRFGMLVGAIGMISRAGWALISVYCLLYVLISLVPFLVWGVARALLPGMDMTGWRAWEVTIASTAEVLTMVLSAALLAATSDRLLHRFGAPTGLRLIQRRRRKAQPARRTPAATQAPAGAPATTEPANNPGAPSAEASGAISSAPATGSTADSARSSPPPGPPPVPRPPE
ncbi:MAG TPA: hypothetical protein H9815_00735 [Candidatus Ruania gallistercoris]|uniref:Uncharacterized protein n=1 Tax=Candidatus Ruania gallistercoris TaxID=2838746 RepID=A0A9D2EAW9_9MICO|nr:hypothetical protein [Candidatus Ruania gallistercoris]